MLLSDFELDGSAATDSPTGLGKKRTLSTDGDRSIKQNVLSPQTLASRADPVTVPVDHLEYDDVILLRPGDMPPADGILVDGASGFDESSLTGEALLVKKNPGDTVMTGTVNQNAAVAVRVVKIGQETMIEGIIRAVSNASSKRRPSKSWLNASPACSCP